MLVGYLSKSYLLAMAAWLLLLAGLFYALLRYRRACRRHSQSLAPAHAGLSLAMLLAAVTAAELVFACFVDFTDTFSVSNVSQRWMARHFDAETNFEFFRDRNELTTYVAPGKERIVFIGDSFTAGHGIVRMDDRFTDRVAADLDRAHPGKYIVQNLGRAGHDVLRVKHFLHRLLVNHYDLAMCVYVYNLNDIDQLDPRTSAALAEIDRSRPTFPLIRDTYFLNWVYFRVLQFNRSAVGSYFQDLAQSYRTKPWDALKARLVEMHRECAEQKVDFRMAIFPFMNDLGPHYPFREAHAKMVEFCKAEKIPVLDLEPVFRTHSGENLMVSRFDAHPNERAHAIAAEAIEKQLLSDVFQSAGPAAASPPMGGPPAAAP